MFSIVIPVYNAKTSLERCVDSWLCQTRKDLEIILMEAKSFATSWLRIILAPVSG